MKICYIANSASSHTVKWVNYFASLGNDVHVISHSNVPIKGAKVHYINYSLKNYPLMVHKVHKLIRNINPDVLHAHQVNTCGLYATSLKGYKTIVSAWGSDILVAPKKSFIMKKIVQYVLKHSYFITSDSHYMSEAIIKLGGNKSKILTFPMGVENDLLNFKHEYNLTSKEIHILSYRRLEKLYNIDIIIKGFSKALKKHKNLYLDIAANGSEFNNLNMLVKSLNIQDHVNFLGAFTRKDLGNMLINNDIFISIPSSDSTSVSLLESMGCGLFPVVSNLPSNLEWVTNYKNGIVLNSIDENNVYNSIDWCIKNYDFLPTASKTNMKIIREKALWQNNSKIIENLYNKLCQ